MTNQDKASIQAQKRRIAQARKKLLNNLSNYGIEWNESERKLEVDDLRETQRQLALATNSSGLKYQEEALPFFAQPNEIDILKVEPYLVVVPPDRETIYRKIWAYALTYWSVPVSTGYGRRLRFLVFDRQNNKLIGLFGLCDPLIGSNIRDEYIGWNREQKHERLYNCMTAYVLGAVPPYNRILGSKLVALSTMFPEVREVFRQKYKDNKTIVSGKEKQPFLAMIDTYGAFQKSAIYTRLTNWKFIGYTQGQSHIHITANGSWELIKQFVPEPQFSKYKYGDGSNWKLRTLKIGLRNLGFEGENILSIGWKRAYYICPLITNWKEYLTMTHQKPIFIKYTQDDLLKYWKERWVKPRIAKLQQQLCCIQAAL